MKIQNKKNNGVLIGAIILVVVVVLGVTAAILFLNSSPSNDSQKKSGNSTTEQDKDTSDDDSSNSSDQNKDNSDSNADQSSEDTREEGKNTPVPDNSGVQNSPNLTGVINYKANTGEALSIRTTINQRVDEGSCILNLTGPNNLKYTTTATIIANPQSSSCAGFDIPLDQLAEDDKLIRGQWNIDIQLTSGTRTGSLQDKITL